MKTPFWIAVLAMMLSFPFANAQPAAEAPAADEAGAEKKQPTEREQMLEIAKLFQSGDIDKAEAAFKQALEANPNSPVLANMHNLAYSALMRANRPAEALAHMEAAAMQQMSEATRTGSAEMFSRLAGMLVAMSEQHMGAGEGAKALERLSAKVEEMPDASLAVNAAIDAQKASQLIADGKTDEARASMAAHADAAKQAAAENADDATAMRTFISVMKDRISVEGKVEGGDADKLSEEMFGYLADAAKSNPGQAGMAYLMEVMTRAGTLARSEPEKASELVKTARAFLEGDGAAIQLPPQFDRQIAQIESSIEQTIRMNALIGQDAAYPENMQAWVNGEELTPEQLKGKVVLLDFFAVWCGPCIATFPHLKQWHEDYSGQGFEIIGVTNYYEYGWDAEAKRPKREPGLEQVAEEEALGQFVAHYELRHPIAYGTDRSLSEHYMVSGIPHMVLIDRQGKVRMFRIGSGDANAHDIEKAIKECLAETADAPSS